MIVKSWLGLAIAVAVGLVWVWMDLARRFAAGRHTRIPGGANDDSVCAACGSRDLAVDGPGLYTCRACGYVGGSGRGRVLAEARRASWRDRPRAERIAAASDDLALARERLDSLEPSAHVSLGLLHTDQYGQALWRPRRRIRRFQAFWDAQRDIENLFAGVVECLSSAAEKVPEIEVPPSPVLATGPCRLGEKWDEVLGDISDLKVAVDRAEKILALVPRNDGPADASA